MADKKKKKPGKPPAFQFYPKEYLTDESVMMMELEHEGAFLRLLAHQWLEGSIPADENAQAKMCRVPVARMRKIWPSIAINFQPFYEQPGRLINLKLHEQKLERAEFTEDAKENGRKGAEKRWGSHSDPNGVAMQTPMGSDSSASASASAEQIRSYENGRNRERPQSAGSLALSLVEGGQRAG